MMTIEERAAIRELAEAAVAQGQTLEEAVDAGARALAGFTSIACPPLDCIVALIDEYKAASAPRYAAAG